MAESPDVNKLTNADARSTGDAKSIGSKTSISVKLPSAQTGGEEDRKKASPPSRRKSGTPTGGFEATLEGQEFGQVRQIPTPASSRHSGLSSSPSRALRQPIHPESELIQQAAATIIERAWIGYRDKQMFRLLKHAVCAAENSLSFEILRKVCPKEAGFLNDKCQQIKVRFRFGGGEFPPMIFFKIFLCSNGKGVKYMSGRRVIKPATEAAEDSLRLMGNRHFYDQMLQDAMFQQQYRITDEVDVTTLKDYMQYLANMDETPAKLGGKENYWRKLTLDILPRHTIFYDVVDYLYNRQMTPRLKAEVPLLVTRPYSQEIQVQHIRAISRMRSPSIPIVPLTTPKSKMSGYQSQVSGRRSKQARMRAMKLRRMYGLDGDSSKLDSQEHTAVSEEPEDYFDKYGITGEDEAEMEEEWEHEASKLYEWTQELSYNDDLMQPSRLLTST